MVIPSQQEFLQDLYNPLIQTFDDVRIDDKKRGNRQLAQVFPYDSDRINRLQEQGAGAYTAINPTTNGSRDISHLKHISAIGLDLDVCKEEEHLNEEEINSKKTELLEKLRKIPYRPHDIIETKNGLQPIYLVKPFTNYSSPEEANELYRGVVDGMCRLIDVKSEGDNVIRVIRLPDTQHLKDPQNPFLNKLIYSNRNKERYDFDEFIEYFKQKEKTEPAREVVPLLIRGDDLISQILALPLTEVIQKAASSKGIDVSFKNNKDGSKQIIENGEPTSGFVSSRGEFCYSSSGKDRKGNQIIVAEYYLGVSRSEVIKWFKNNFCSSKTKSENNEKYNFTHIGDLLSEPEENISWVVDGMLPSGGFSLLIAKPKVGKSTIVRQLALCVSRGGEFLGRSTTQGRVLYVSLEEKRQEVKNHFRLMAAEGTEDLGIYVGSTPEDAHHWLEREVEKQQPVLVVVDTLFRFTRVTDLNDYAKTLVALDPLLALARTHGAHVMGLHHARKSPGDGADSTLGSTAIFGSVDTAIILKRTEGKRTIETQQRYGQDMEPTVLVFNSETKMTTLGGTKEEEDLRKIELSILAFLKSIEKPVEESTIDAEVEGKTGLRRKALRNLVSKNEVIRTGLGKKGNPYQYSCFLVPSLCVEQENQTNKNANKWLLVEDFSSSQELASFSDFRNEEIPLLIGQLRQNLQKIVL